MATRKSITIACTMATLAAASAAVPLAASAQRHHRSASDGRLVIGVRVDFTSATDAAGTFAACCAVDDAGAARAHVTSFTPRADNTADFEATETLAGSAGTITLALRGSTGPLDSARHIARGGWSVTRGTGAYAGLEGRGRFRALTDEDTGALTAINSGHAR